MPKALIKENTDLKNAVAKIEPAWNEYLDNFRNRFQIGTVIYGGYKMYTAYRLWSRAIR